MTVHFWLRQFKVQRASCSQAAREIAGTIANSNNRVFLNSDSLLLNLVRKLLSRLPLSWLPAIIV